MRQAGRGHIVQISSVLGLVCLGASWFLTGLNFVVTVHYRRPAGMGFFDMPIMAWSLYLSGYQLVVAGGSIPRYSRTVGTMSTVPT